MSEANQIRENLTQQLPVETGLASISGIDERISKETHIEAFAKEIRAQLGLPEEEYNDNKEALDTSAIRFKDCDFEQLSKLQEILNLTNDDAD